MCSTKTTTVRGGWMSLAATQQLETQRNYERLRAETEKLLDEESAKSTGATQATDLYLLFWRPEAELEQRRDSGFTAARETCLRTSRRQNLPVRTKLSVARCSARLPDSCVLVLALLSSSRSAHTFC